VPVFKNPSGDQSFWFARERERSQALSSPFSPKTNVTDPESLPPLKYSKKKSSTLYGFCTLGAVYWCGGTQKFNFLAILYTILVDFLIIADFIALMTMAFKPKYYSKFTIISFVVYQFFLYSTRVSMWYSMNCDYKFGRNLEIAVKQIDRDAVRLNKYFTALFFILFIPILGAATQPFLFYYFSHTSNHWAHWHCMILNGLSVFFINFGFLLWSFIVSILCSFHVQYLTNILDRTRDMVPVEDPQILFNQYKGILARIRGTKENLRLGVNTRALFGVAVVIFTILFYNSENPKDKISNFIAHQTSVDFTTFVFLFSLILEHYGLRQVNALCEKVESNLSSSFSHESEKDLLINVKLLGYRVRKDNYMHILGFTVDHIMVWFAPIWTLFISYIKIEQIFLVNHIDVDY